MTRKITKKVGYVIIGDTDASPATPLICPICELAMSTRDDVSSYMHYSCCSWCERMWVDGRNERWQNGWRPSKEAVTATLEGLGMI